MLLTFPGLGGAPETGRCCSDRVFYNMLLTSRVLEGLPETARCRSDHVFYNVLLTFPGLGGIATGFRLDIQRMYPIWYLYEQM